MAEPRKTLVTIATYNEIENLPTLVDEIFRFAPQFDLLVVDDGSPDGTGQWCDEHAPADSRIRCIHRSGKLGLGTAIVAGLKYAIDKGYDFVVTMDADFSHHPRYLPDLVDGMDRGGQGNVDVMIGSRYIPGGRIEGWPLKRHFMSRAINLYARTLLRLRTKDCSGGFRCYRTSRLAQLDFDSILSRGYSFQEELLWRLKRIGCRIDETPITFVDRINGTSKIHAGEATAALRVLATLGASSLIGRR
jgi:dolichol-phosphate mannosyltransferase